MQRRSLLKTAGGIGAATAAGGLGLIALTGNAAASVSASGASAETDDGSVEWVGIGGHVNFEWDGLDSEAQYGEVVIETNLDSNNDGWTDHGTVSGPLGDDEDAEGHDGDGEFDYEEGNSSNSWGGVNDENTGPGTDGSFTFRFGSPHGQKDYAIAYDQGDYDDGGFETRDALPTENPWSPSEFEAGDNDSTNATAVLVRVTGRVYDGNPGEGASMLVEDSDDAEFTVGITNRKTTGTANGNVTGAVGADES